MGRIIIYGNKSGEGGADTSVVTANASDVLIGKIIVNADGEPISGTMPNNGTIAPRILNAGEAFQIPEGYHSGAGIVTTNNLSNQTQATAVKEDILKGKSAWVNGVKIDGEMIDRGAVSKTLVNGENYTIPKGYHDGNGIIAVGALSDQTPGSAVASQILLGKTAWVNGNQITGEMLDNTGINTNGSVPGVSVDNPTIPTREAESMLMCNDSYGVNRFHICPPPGYYQGGGNSFINRPASEFGNATVNKVLNGYTFTSENGIKITGNVQVTSAINFKVTTLSSTSVQVSWTNPSKGVYSGVRIRYSDTGYPGTSGGTLAYTGTGSSTSPGGTSSCTITNLSAGTTYYFTCTSYGTGLGDGASYNVSGRTSGYALITKGVLKNGLTIGYSYVTQQSGYIRFAGRSLYSSAFYSNNAVNFGSYSKCYIRVSVTYMAQSYLRFMFSTGENLFAKDYYSYSTIYNKGQYLASVSLASTSYSGTYHISIGCSSGTNGGTGGVGEGNIYDMWLE